MLEQTIKYSIFQNKFNLNNLKRIDVYLELLIATMKKAITIFLLITSTPALSQSISHVKIGNQVWMQDNLTITVFRNGDVMPEIKNKEDWLKAGYKKEPAWCYYNFDNKNAHYGILYNYYAASDPRNIAPIGWKVPSLQDYYILINTLDPLCTKEYFAENGSLAGGSLKTKDSVYWQGSICPQISSNFNVLPAGGYYPHINSYVYDWVELGKNAGLWCITDWNWFMEFIEPSEKEKLNKQIQSGDGDDQAIVIKFSNESCTTGGDNDPKICGYSIRLLKEN